jgi:hypothetical protein
MASFPLPAGQTLATIQTGRADGTRRRGPEDIITRQGHTDAVAASRIIDCVLRDERPDLHRLDPRPR